MEDKMWFNELANNDDPGKDELKAFVGNVLNFLDYILKRNTEFAFLWEGAPDLHDLAVKTFSEDIRPEGLKLAENIENDKEIDPKQLRNHGLTGQPLKFKFQALCFIDNKLWDKVKKGFLSVKEWLKKILNAIDAILDSIIAAAGGIGGSVKEFKAILFALI